MVIGILPEKAHRTQTQSTNAKEYYLNFTGYFLVIGIRYRYTHTSTYIYMYVYIFESAKYL